jgi:hypothetical protein
MVHPEPAPVVMVEVAQGQGLAPAPDAVAQGQVQAGAPAAAAAEQGEDANGNAPPPGVLMVDLLWAPGTRWGVGIRLAQALLAATAIAFMISTHDFRAVTAFRCVPTIFFLLWFRFTAQVLGTIWLPFSMVLEIPIAWISSNFRDLKVWVTRVPCDV